MSDEDCITFLKWCLPRLELRWQGYRKVHRTVSKRLGRRIRELGLQGLSQYQAWLMVHPDEWAHLEVMCRIPISRFYRDRDVFEVMAVTVLPQSIVAAARRGIGAVRCWSAGCASGEEPYSMVLLWWFATAHDPQIGLRIVATDADEVAIRRAESACYEASSLKDLPREWLAQAFHRSNASFCLNDGLREKVDFHLQDIKQAMPDGPFEIILCRNLVFTYFDETLQRAVLARILDRLAPEGFLVLGKHEALPADSGRLARLTSSVPIYRRTIPTEQRAMQG
jgi:chemotaxis protein methyltransferase CheR